MSEHIFTISPAKAIVHGRLDAGASVYLGSAFNSTTSAVNAGRLLMSSGNIASGTATLYGVK